MTRQLDSPNGRSTKRGTAWVSRPQRPHVSPVGWTATTSQTVAGLRQPLVASFTVGWPGLWAFLVVIGFLASHSSQPSLGACQDERPSAAGESPAPRIQVSPLETYYIPDKDGRLIPVFQFPFEEFERLLRQERGGSQSVIPASGFRVVQANFAGQVEPDLQRARLRLRLRLILNQTGWTPVPLGLAGWVVDGMLQGPAGVSHYLSRNETGQLLLHVAGPAEEVLEFDLPLSRRVVDLGAVQQLPVGFPYPTELAFNLRLPSTSLDVRGGEVADLQATPDDGGTTVRVRELNEKSVIAWQEIKGPAQAFPIKARVDSALRVQALGERTWQVSAQVNVVPLDGALAELLVALPANAENFMSPQNSVRVDRVSVADLQRPEGTLPQGQHYYRLSLDNPLTEATPLQLTYNVTGDISAEATGSRVQLGGPVWLDCLFAPGSLELTKDRELSTVWQLAGGISLRPTVRENLETTLFNIERPDFRLELLNRPQAAQVRVTSEYELIVTQRIVLTARFHCQIQGKFSEPLWIDPGDWQFVLGDPGIQARDNRLMIDPAGQAVSSDGDLTFRCTLELETPDPFRLNLPRLQGDVAMVQQPGRVLLVLGDPSKSFEFSAGDSTLLQDATTPMQFRARDANSDWVLSGQIGLRPRVVSLEQMAQLTANNAPDTTTPGPMGVTQSIQLEVSHQPLQGLTFLLPTPDPVPQLQVQLNGEVLAYKSTPIEVLGRRFQAIEFALPPERLRGKLAFNVSHLLEPAKPSGAVEQETSLFEVPLIQLLFDPLTRLFNVADEEGLEQFLTQQLAGVQIRSREIRSVAPLTRDLTINSPVWGGWLPLTNEANLTRWLAPGPWPQRAVVSVPPRRAIVAETTVENVHVRTWWSSDQRREQWLATISTNQTRLELPLPQAVEIRRVLVNGRGVAWEQQRRLGRLAFDLPPTSNTFDPTSGSSSTGANQRATEVEPNLNQRTPLSRLRIEIWYSSIQDNGPWTQVLWQAPRLPNQEWCRQFTWELIASDWWQLASAGNDWTVVADASQLGIPTDALARGTATSDSLPPGLPAMDGRAIDASVPDSVSTQTVTTDPDVTEGDGLETRATMPAGDARWVFASHRPPENGGPRLVNRRWLRAVSIVGLTLGVACAWLLGWYRQPPFWLLLAGTIMWVSWQYPHVGSELGPWAAVAILCSIVIIGIEGLTRQPVPSTPAYELTSETTRTYWAESDSGQERSGPSQSQRGSLVAGEPAP